MPTYSDHFTGEDAVAYGDWPVPARTLADVWQGFPSWWTVPDSPLRDAVGAGLRRLWLDVASVAARASKAHLRAHAKGWTLDLVARGVGLTRAEGEGDAVLRARIATVDDAQTELALQAAFDAATAPLTTRRVRIVLPWRHGAYAGRCFLGRAPIDPVATRLTHPLSVPFVSGSQVLSHVGPVRLFRPGFGRFVLALPRLFADAGTVLSSAPSPDPRASFLAPAPSVGRSHLGRPFAARELYRSIALLTERLRAAGIRWGAFIDTTN